MKSGLVSLLTGESTINSIVSSRVYIGNAPEKAKFPYVVITQMAADDFIRLDGGTGNMRALDFDIDCKSSTSVQTETLANAVRNFLKDYAGAAGSYTIGAVLLNDEVDDIEAATDGSDKHTYVTTLDFTIQFNP